MASRRYKKQKDLDENGIDAHIHPAMWGIAITVLIAALAITAMMITDLVYDVDTNNKVSGLDSACETKTIALFDFTDSDAVQTNPPTGFAFFSTGDFTGNDGNVTQKNGYVQISSVPFTATVEQGVFGVLDHVKWLAYINHTFDLSLQHEVVCSASLSVQCSGLSGQPFGDQVQDADADIRLCGAAVNTLDPVNFGTADFFMTNTKIYALYERLPFARTNVSNYAAYTFVVPVGDRIPGDYHTLAVAFNLKNQYIRWILDGEEVFRVDTVGMLLTRQYMIIDHGGQEESIFPQSIQCGLGTFSLLDGYAPCVDKELNAGGAQQCTFTDDNVGLVQLGEADQYFNPRTGLDDATFFNTTDPESLRLFGQGANINIRNLKVYSQTC